MGLGLTRSGLTRSGLTRAGLGPDRRCCLGGGALLVLLACADIEALTEGAPCPCGPEQACCEPLDRCLPVGADCPILPELRTVTPPRGPVEGGFSLRMEGARLSAAEGVTVGGRPCPIERASASEIECRAPEGPLGGGVADVQVEVDGEIVHVSGAFEWLARDFIERRSLGDEAFNLLGIGVAAEDFDGDGRLELVFGHEAEWFSDPEVTRPRLYEIGEDLSLRAGEALPEVATHHAVAAGDFDGDGDTDLITAGRRGLTALTILWNEEEGWRSEPQVGFRAYEIMGLNVLDWEGDGDLDVLGCTRQPNAPGTGGFLLAENRGGRLFNHATATSTSVVLSGCRSMVAGDLDGDLEAEFLAVGTQGPWFTKRVDGRLENFLITPAILYMQFDQHGAFLDVDLDGRQDALISPSTRFWPRAPDEVSDVLHGMWMVKNVAEDEPRWRVSWPRERLDLEPGPDCPAGDRLVVIPNLRLGAEAFIAEDLDLDGDEDLFLPMPSSNCGLGPGWYESRAQQGEVGFVFRSLGPASGGLVSPTGGVAADLDRDGDPDLVIHNRWRGRIAVFENVINERRGFESRPLTMRARTDADGDATDEDLGDDRWARGLVLQIDLDGPDFDPEADRIRSRVIGGAASYNSLGPPERIFGRPEPGPIWVRTKFADGSVATRRVEANEAAVVLVDCAAAVCP